MSTKRKKLLLLDSHAIIHRAFHGVPPLSMDDGTPTNAVYGYASTLLSVLEKFQPDYVVAAFDRPGGTFRNDLYPAYKGNRSAPADDLIPQFDLTRSLVKSFGIPVVDAENFEADDVIGTLAAQATGHDVETIIVTGDRDTLQLVDNHVGVFTMSRGLHDMKIYDTEAVKEKMGVDVDQIIDFKGICGDSSDHIPGVRGIGEKGAQTLLAEYGSLEGIYENIEDIRPSLQKKLIEHKEMAFLSRTLGIIDTAVPVTLDLDAADTAHISYDGARAAFGKFGFTSLMKRLGQKNVGGEQVKKEVENVNAASQEEWATFQEDVAGKKVCVVPDHDEYAIYGWGFSAGEKESIYVAHTQDMEKFFLSNTCDLIAYDAKSLWHLCDCSGNAHPMIKDDLLLLAYAARTGKKVDLAHLIFDITGIDVSEEKLAKQMALDLRDHAGSRARAAEYARLMYVVYEKIMKETASITESQAQEFSVQTLYATMEYPLARVLYGMEVAGVAFDTAIFESIATETNEALEKLRTQIYDLSGEEFNINSTKQLRVILFEKLELPVSDIKKTKTGYSTASSELEKLRVHHDVITHIERYRELFKLKTTYIDTLPGFAVADGRIHTTYHQEGTSTGRLSSSDPNLQNIPIRTESGRALRKAFVASSGKKLISADYSQIDLRCVAHVAQDTQMIQAFQKGDDIHTVTAASVLGKPVEEITKEERSQAKELNFGLIYGMGPHAFAKSAHVSIAEAKVFIDTYFTNFSGVKQYMEDTRNSATELGYVETLFGRRHYVSGITSHNTQMKASAERAAINMPIQGLTADIMKLAMIAVDTHIKENYPDTATLLLQIHDEVIVEADEFIAPQLAGEIEEVMRGAYVLDVPLIVDTAIGNHWGEL